MQNLRDKLLKAGLVTQKQVERAEKAPAHRPRPGPPPARPVSEEERQRREAFAAHDAEKAAERQKELEKLAEARAQSERAHALRALIEEHALREPPGEVAFHYQKRSGKIGRLALSPETAALLEAGKAAVVEDPGRPDPAIVPAHAAKKAWKIDPRAVFFWAGPEKPIGFDDPGPVVPGEDAG